MVYSRPKTVNRTTSFDSDLDNIVFETVDDEDDAMCFPKGMAPWEDPEGPRKWWKKFLLMPGKEPKLTYL